MCLPHADGDKGFLKDYIKTSKKDEEFIINGGIVEKVLKSPNMLGVCISNEGSIMRFRPTACNIIDTSKFKENKSEYHFTKYKSI